MAKAVRQCEGIVENCLRNEKTASAALVDAIRRIGSSPSSLWYYRGLRYRVACLFTSNIWLECHRKLGHLVYDLLIIRTEHRDTEAIQAKLDELLRTHGEARDELTTIDEKEVEEITAHRAKERENDAQSTAKRAK